MLKKRTCERCGFESDPIAFVTVAVNTTFYPLCADCLVDFIGWWKRKEVIEDGEETTEGREAEGDAAEGGQAEATVRVLNGETKGEEDVGDGGSVQVGATEDCTAASGEGHR